MGRLTSMVPRLGGLPARVSRHTDAEGHSQALEPWRAWYKLKAWEGVRQRVFLRDGYTCQCGCAKLITNPRERIADHIDDRDKLQRDTFFDDARVQTLWKPHHDSWKQRHEPVRAKGGRGSKSSGAPRFADRWGSHSEVFFSMGDKSDGPKDLFGDPWTPPRDPRGRKRHKRDPEVAEKVAVLRGAGLSAVNIALRVGLSEPTLRKYYFRELSEGATLARAVLVEAQWKKAKDGVVGAARFIREEFDKGQAAVPVPRRGAAEPKDEKLGKKAQATKDAQTAHEGTSWGDLLN